MVFINVYAIAFCKFNYFLLIDCSGWPFKHRKHIGLKVLFPFFPSGLANYHLLAGPMIVIWTKHNNNKCEYCAHTKNAGKKFVEGVRFPRVDSGCSSSFEYKLSDDIIVKLS